MLSILIPFVVGFFKHTALVNWPLPPPPPISKVSNAMVLYGERPGEVGMKKASIVVVVVRPISAS